jgi:hypothetical protein
MRKIGVRYAEFEPMTNHGLFENVFIRKKGGILIGTGSFGKIFSSGERRTFEEGSRTYGRDNSAFTV